jgi:hypothetical protein
MEISKNPLHSRFLFLLLLFVTSLRLFATWKWTKMGNGAVVGQKEAKRLFAFRNSMNRGEKENALAKIEHSSSQSDDTKGILPEKPTKDERELLRKKSLCHGRQWLSCVAYCAAVT